MPHAQPRRARLRYARRRRADPAVGRLHRTLESAQRPDVVHDERRPPVRADHEVVIPRVHDERHRRARREAVLELVPVRAPVAREPQPELRSEEQQVGVERILLDRQTVAAHVRLDDVPPGLAEVGRLVDVALQVVAAVVMVW